MIRFAPLLLLAACVQSVPPPYVGDCAAYPDGQYQYGEIGIGTCLSGPADVAFVGDRLLVSNANPWGDFSGGSILSLDLAALPLDGDTHLVTELEPAAVSLPSFMGDFALAESDTLLLATNKLSEGSRTREAADHLWFVDVSDPAAPVLAEGRGEDGASMEVGADPTGIHWDPTSGVAMVVNRTDHSISLVDTTVSPAEVVPPGGSARALERAFVDVDASGSRASFVTLETVEVDSHTARTWELDWSVGGTRVWVPTSEGLYRMNGNGEDTWSRSPLPLDLDPTVSDGLVNTLSDPWYIAYSDTEGYLTGRLFFMSDGEIRAATTQTAVEAFAFEEAALLQPDETGWDAVIGGPAAVYADLVWFLYYDGGDGTTQSIGAAISADGVNFIRGEEPLLVPTDGTSFEDPFVVFDSQADRWRMWFTVVDGASWTIGEASSDDLVNWTDTGTRWAPPGGQAAAPAVQYYGGRFHMLYDQGGFGNDVHEAVSVDGTHWEAVGTAFPVDTPRAGDGPRRVAFFGLAEGAWYLRDTSGDVLAVPVKPGDTVSDSYNGFSVRVAVGQWLDPADAGAAGAGGTSLDALHEGLAYVSLVEAEGVGTIAVGTQVGRGFSLATEPALAPGAAGSWDAEQVSSAVVTTIGGTRVMYYAGTADGLTRIGRATSDDGLSWTADADPVLEPTEDWEAAGVYPTSITVGEDGALHLYYTGWDGESYRVGEAVSDDGIGFTRVPGADELWTFEGGALGEWDDSGARDAWVEWDDAAGVDRMWFAGTSGESWQIGYAERVPGEAWVSSVDADGAGRPVVTAGPGSFGAGGVVRPVLSSDADGWILWYTGLDEGVARSGRARLGDADRAWRDLDLPTLSDTWGFTVVPENEEEAIALGVDTSAGTQELTGCGTLALDDARGLLYVGCELSPTVLVLDLRDDSDGVFLDMNYLNVEALVTFTSTLSATAGVRGLMFDPVHDWLWFLSDSPEAAFALDLAQVEDDADGDTISDAIVASLVLPRGNARDEGVDTQAFIGPGRMALHPDGHHVFVTNFNNNSVTAYDLAVGAPGTLVAESTGLGENPYVAEVSPDGRFLVVGNYAGEVEQARVSSTLVVLDADPTSPTFLEPLAWIGNQ